MPSTDSQLEEAILDVTNLSCPLPVLKTNKAMRDLKRGEILVIKATDMRAVADIETLCQTKGHLFLSSTYEESKVTIRIRKL